MSVDEFIEQIRERIIKELLDLLILGSLSKSRSPMGGYDVILFIHRKFHVLVSSGTVYSLIYRMEREGLIRGMRERRKRVYVLTEKGKETVAAVLDKRNGIINLVQKLLMKD